MKDHTVHYHVEDIPASRIHQHMIPGHGSIDFIATLREIHATDYDGWLTVELYPYIDMPDQAAEESRQYLRRVLDKLGISETPVA